MNAADPALKRPTNLAALLSGLAMACLATSYASAAERWQEAAGGAVAIMPKPSETNGIIGGSLYCAEQKWGFQFRLDPAAASGGGAAVIGLEGQVFKVNATVAPGTLTVGIPYDVIELMKVGTRMRFETGDAVKLRAIFGLAGSGKVLDAIAGRCTPIDMSGFKAVTLSAGGPAVDAATTVFADEIKLFKAAAKQEPTVAATEVPLSDGKRLMFADLCGSTTYYGKSGCTTWGWASGAASEPWKPVYATEGVQIYLDEKSMVDGWPGLASVAKVNGSRPNIWRWSGEAYVGDQGADAADADATSQ